MLAIYTLKKKKKKIVSCLRHWRFEKSDVEAALFLLDMINTGELRGFSLLTIASQYYLQSL